MLAHFNFSRRINLGGTLLQSPLRLWPRIRGSPFKQHHGGESQPSIRICYPQRSFRTKFRRHANKADNKAATLAVDALINFEAVKVR